MKRDIFQGLKIKKIYFSKSDLKFLAEISYNKENISTDFQKICKTNRRIFYGLKFKKNIFQKVILI